MKIRSVFIWTMTCKQGILQAKPNHLDQLAYAYNLGKNFSKQHFEIFFNFFFFKKSGFDISCKLCMKCQILSSRKKKICLSSAEFAHSMINVYLESHLCLLHQKEHWQLSLHTAPDHILFPTKNIDFFLLLHKNILWVLVRSAPLRCF